MEPPIKGGQTRRNWIKLDVHFLNDPKIRALSDPQVVIYLHILACRARSSCDLLSISCSNLATICQKPVCRVLNPIVKLLKLGLIKIEVPLLEEKRREEKERREESGERIATESEPPEIQKPEPTRRARKAVSSVIALPPPGELTGEWVYARLHETTWEEIHKIYEQDGDFIETNCRKMAVWLEANRERTPKNKGGWSRFINRWLGKSWEWHRKNKIKEKPEIFIDHDALWAKKKPNG